MKASAIRVLNVLMTEGDFLSTQQISKRTGVERKTIYTSVERLEINGFGIDMIQIAGRNYYKFRGIYGIY